MEKVYKGVIYMYESPSGKRYIGQTTRPEKRRKEFLNLNQDYAGYKINNARKKYGPENFKYVELISCVGATKEELKANLNLMESLHIEFFNTMEDGYNRTEGGENVYIPSEETKRKISEKLKGKQSWNKGIHTGLTPWNKGRVGVQKGWNKGQHRSEETKRKISEKLKGNIPWNKGLKKNREIKGEISLW